MTTIMILCSNECARARLINTPIDRFTRSREIIALIQHVCEREKCEERQIPIALSPNATNFNLRVTHFHQGNDYVDDVINCIVSNEARILTR